MTQELIDLLREIRPNYSDVGSRDVDTTRRQKQIDRAIELLGSKTVAFDHHEVDHGTHIELVPHYRDATDPAPTLTLADLHKELNRITWMGADEGWDRAIDAVRARIVEMLEAPTAPAQPCGEDAADGAITAAYEAWLRQERARRADFNSLADSWARSAWKACAALTAEKVAGEPVAWLHVIAKPGKRTEWASIEEDDTPDDVRDWMDKPNSYRVDKPLYLAASQQPTQSAEPTDDEIEAMCAEHGLGPNVGKLVVKDALNRWRTAQSAEQDEPCTNCGMSVDPKCACERGRKRAASTQSSATVPIIEELSKDSHDFKNFHWMLCKVFGYVHDDRDWRRDQLSLINWIATATQPVQAERGLTKLRSLLENEIAHSEFNDLRLAPDFGRVQGDLAVRAASIQAFLDNPETAAQPASGGEA